MFIKKIRKNDNRTIILFGFIKIKYKKHYSYKKLKQKNIELQRSLNYLKEHINPADIKPATGILRKYQLELVDFADDFCKKVKIKPILYAGNMLGAVRNNAFIPWDDDMDFLLIRSDYERVIQWCQNNGVVCFFHKNMATNVFHRLHDRVTQYPGQYVLDVWYNLMQLSYGTSFEDQLIIDFYPLDFYKENYSFNKHKEYVHEIKQQAKTMVNIEEATNFVRNEVFNNPNVSMEPTNEIYYGFDGPEPKSWTTEFMPYDSLYPLKKVKFENKEFYLPNKPGKWLDINYQNWDQIPNDVGFSHHLYYKDLYLKQKKQ